MPAERAAPIYLPILPACQQLRQGIGSSSAVERTSDQHGDPMFSENFGSDMRPLLPEPAPLKALAYPAPLTHAPASEQAGAEGCSPVTSGVLKCLVALSSLPFLRSHQSRFVLSEAEFRNIREIRVFSMLSSADAGRLRRPSRRYSASLVGGGSPGGRRLTHRSRSPRGRGELVQDFSRFVWGRKHADAEMEWS